MIMFMTASIDRKTHVKPQNTDLCRLTAGVTRWWAGVDTVWKREELKARDRLEKRADSHLSGARIVSLLLTFVITISHRQTHLLYVWQALAILQMNLKLLSTCRSKIEGCLISVLGVLFHPRVQCL